eukprot:TRINITY_DN67901_c1_g2_i2.p2 TRINITY_DN67901_c1_g2~~TRINITY_DN67901_c1_g2_i2.p2  ORF type:complete len:444 (-),score=34.81 TRINITY_DN67901_c1_g2_i2:1231-2562(-)
MRRFLTLFLFCLVTLPTTQCDEFTANWLGHLLPVLGDLTYLDLSLPGTHDTMTYDLSNWIADGTNDIPPWLAATLHDIPPHLVGPFIKQFAQTQWLNVTEQLDSGVRYLDFRIMYTLGEVIVGKKEWYCIHFLQTHKTALHYLQEVQQWVKAHPKEIVTLTLSRHGNVCNKGNDQYPDVSKKIKQEFWKEIETLFDGLLFDNTQSATNLTKISTLINTNQRVVIYASDYVEFTGSSRHALDTCGNWSGIDNQLKGGTGPKQFNGQLSFFANAAEIRAKNKQKNYLFLLSTAGDATHKGVEEAALIEYLPFIEKKKHERDCAASFKIPGMTNWCPLLLLELSQLAQFYNQRTLEIGYQAIKKGNFSWAFPNAIYTGAVDVNGTVRTGTQVTRAQQFPQWSDLTLLTRSTLRQATNKTTQEKTAASPGVKMKLPPSVARHPRESC